MNNRGRIRFPRFYKVLQNNGNTKSNLNRKCNFNIQNQGKWIDNINALNNTQEAKFPPNYSLWYMVG